MLDSAFVSPLAPSAPARWTCRCGSMSSAQDDELGTIVYVECGCGRRMQRAPSEPPRCPHGIAAGKPCWSCHASQAQALRDDAGQVVECRACCNRVQGRARPATCVVDGDACCAACAAVCDSLECAATATVHLRSGDRFCAAHVGHCRYCKAAVFPGASECVGCAYGEATS